MITYFTPEGGEKAVDSFYEFVPLGNDQYAFQTPSERLVVDYTDAVKSMTYTSLDIDAAQKYDVSTEGIYPKGEGANVEWVKQRGAFTQVYSFDGSTLTVEAKGMFNNEPKTVVVPVA